MMFLASTFIEVPGKIFAVFRLGYDAFHSNHTMVSGLDFVGCACSTAEGKTYSTFCSKRPFIATKRGVPNEGTVYPFGEHASHQSSNEVARGIGS